MPTTHVPTRDEALALLTTHTTTESLIKHALAVEAVMRHLARKHGEDETKWGVIGLVHDLDYQEAPENHCARTKEILEANGWPDEYVRAVMSHGWGILTDTEPRTLLEKTLYAADELTGLITACALVRPSRSLSDLEPKSVRKKWNVRSFAAGADRTVIEKGAAMLGVELNDLIADTIAGMRTVAADLGLQ